jgi:hypothetical protein
MTRLLLVLFLLSCAEPAMAWPRRSSSRGYSTSYSQPVSGDTSTAQGVAEIQARQGRVGHHGGNRGHEGCGSGPTPESALANCCYSQNGWPVVDQGVARGAGGQWFACKRYGSR